VFYQFERPPIVFNDSGWKREAKTDANVHLGELEQKFTLVHAEKSHLIEVWVQSRGTPFEAEAQRQVRAASDKEAEVQDEARKTIAGKGNEADYVFIRFILRYLPHGLIGLLVAAFFAAALSSKAAELNALASTTTIDLYRHIIRREASDRHYVIASKLFTVFWGLVALGFALFANMVENLIQAANIVGSLFYGVPLALFLIAFFMKPIRGKDVFYSAIVSEVLVIVLYFTLNISYLWYNFIGCAACVVLSAVCWECFGGDKTRPQAVSAEV
jgi:Na+/proline symporter